MSNSACFELIPTVTFSFDKSFQDYLFDLFWIFFFFCNISFPAFKKYISRAHEGLSDQRE